MDHGAPDHDMLGRAGLRHHRTQPKSSPIAVAVVADDLEAKSAPARPVAASAPDAGRVGPNLLKSWLLLLVSDQPSHGYQLVEALDALGVRLGNSGYVYRTLRTMEASGILASAWQHSGAGPPHRVYQLTSAGYQALDHCAAGIGTLDAQIHDYLALYEQTRGDGWAAAQEPDDGWAAAKEPDGSAPSWLATGPLRSLRGRRGRAAGDA